MLGGVSDERVYIANKGQNGCPLFAEEDITKKNHATIRGSCLRHYQMFLGNCPTAKEGRQARSCHGPHQAVSLRAISTPNCPSLVSQGIEIMGMAEG